MHGVATSSPPAIPPTLEADAAGLVVQVVRGKTGPGGVDEDGEDVAQRRDEPGARVRERPRRPDERDRRALLVSLTPVAEQRLDAMRVKNRQRIRRICADWTPEERQVFGRLLPRFAKESGPVFGGSPATEGSAAAPARR